jgi:hypothetical protein
MRYGIDKYIQTDYKKIIDKTSKINENMEYKIKKHKKHKDIIAIVNTVDNMNTDENLHINIDNIELNKDIDNKSIINNDIEIVNNN